MTGIMNIRRCGGCHFAKLTPQVAASDLSKRVCFGAPPSAQIVPGPQPNALPNLRMVRPVISVSDDACALWRGKDAEDIANDVEDFKALQRIQDTSDTRQ